jgi:hypothetical protein
MNVLILFSLLTVVNVIFSTIKSIVTIKSGKTVASLISAGYYGYYNVVLIYTVADFPLWQKVVVTFLANLVGVWLVKWGEEKAKKDKLWKVEATINKADDWERLIGELKDCGVPCNYIDIDKYILINCYCATQKQSTAVKELLNCYDVKYFVSETKNL